MVKLEDIEFPARIELQQHPRYSEFGRLIGQRDFAAYREVFERGWAEISILCGHQARLEALPIASQPPRNSFLANLLGVNEHSPRRVRMAKEFFDTYERMGRGAFIKRGACDTSYVDDLRTIIESRIQQLRGIRRGMALRRQRKQIERRVIRFLNVYENMKQYRTLVGQACTLQTSPGPIAPADIPWAIDYCGYIKLRDGAHRRAAAHYLGWQTIPTLVFEFDHTTADSLAEAHQYIKDNFHWFAALVQEAAHMDSHSIGGYPHYEIYK